MPKVVKVMATATLKDNSGNPLAGTIIAIECQKAGEGPRNWGMAGPGPTNSAGVMSRLLQLQPGTYNIRAVFPGEPGFEKALGEKDGLVLAD